MTKKCKKIIVCTLAAVFLLAGCFHTKPDSKRVDLTFYGLDDSDAWSDIISAYQKKYSNVHIKYKKWNDAEQFEDLLVNEIAEGEGPDIFYLKSTWLPRHTKKIVPLESKQFASKQFSETFVNVAAEDFIQPSPSDGQKKIYALPLYVDTLALYYNKKHFEQKVPERGKPGQTWEAIKEDAAKFREQDSEGKLVRGEIALGRADTISLTADILYNLFLQAGVTFYDSSFQKVDLPGEAEKQFDYFVSFAGPQNKNFSWNTDVATIGQSLGPLPAKNEVEAFLAGKVSAIFGYSDLYYRLETELKNVRSRLFSDVSIGDIALTPSLQMSTESEDFKVWANYYGLAVSRNSKNAKSAWDFIQFATSKTSAQSYHKATKRPAARRDLIEEQKKEPITDIFISQVGYAGSLHIFSDRKFGEFLKEAVHAANSGQTSKSALASAEEKMNSVLKTEAPEGLYPKPKKK